MKKIVCCIVFLMTVLTLSGCKKTAKIILPEKENISKIVFSEINIEDGKDGKLLYNIDTDIKDKEKVEEFLKVFTEIDEVSSDSVNDNPSNVSKYYKIEFFDEKEKSSVAYIYELKGKFYFEQPYQKIFKVKKQVYEKLLSFR